jgi:hypothetical protein
MPVILNTPYVPTVPQYDKVHLDHLTIMLEKTDYAKTQIQARVRMYYQGEDGVKHFSSEHREIFIDDATSWVTQLAMGGDMRGVEADNHIKAIVALLVETMTDLGETQVV